MTMNKTLRTAIPILVLVGLALMTPTAAADPGDDGPLGAINPPPCNFVAVQTPEVSIGGIVTVFGQYFCI